MERKSVDYKWMEGMLVSPWAREQQVQGAWGRLGLRQGWRAGGSGLLGTEAGMESRGLGAAWD